jgi:hypothetical protein
VIFEEHINGSDIILLDNGIVHKRDLVERLRSDSKIDRELVNELKKIQNNTMSILDTGKAYIIKEVIDEKKPFYDFIKERLKQLERRGYPKDEIITDLKQVETGHKKYLKKLNNYTPKLDDLNQIFLTQLIDEIVYHWNLKEKNIPEKIFNYSRKKGITISTKKKKNKKTDEKLVAAGYEFALKGHKTCIISRDIDIFMIMSGLQHLMQSTELSEYANSFDNIKTVHLLDDKDSYIDIYTRDPVESMRKILKNENQKFDVNIIDKNLIMNYHRFLDGNYMNK